MIKGHCDCGSVTIAIPHLPDTMNACPCEFCRRTGAHWGYFPRGAATIAGPTLTYRRGSRTVDFHRCGTCGVLTHWIGPDGQVEHMGVHMQNFDRDRLDGVRIVVEP